MNRIELICGKRPAFYQVDVTDEAALDKVFEENPDIDNVIHFAALKVRPLLDHEARPQDSALASIKYNNHATRGSTSSLVSDTSSAVSALEAEEKSLRDRLIVLEEQKFFVSEMIADANRRRKFDEVSSLAVNVEDLSREIDRVNGMLAGLDFEGVYTGNFPAST